MIVESTDDLGTPDVDGTVAWLAGGSGPTNYQERLIWNLSKGVWVGKPKYSMRQIDVFGMNHEGDPALWLYPFNTSGVGSVDTGFGFQIWPVRQLGALMEAGLSMQESINAVVKMTASGSGKLALNWYGLKTGDGFLSPVPDNFGVELDAIEDVNQPRFVSTGWQVSPIDAIGGDENGYPELYCKGATLYFWRLAALHRFVFGDTSGSPDDDGMIDLPITNNLFSHHVANDVPLASGSSVAEWADYSGHNRTLLQSNASKRPVLVRNVLNGKAVVRFDGVDDFMQTVIGDTGAQPFTIFAVLKQFSGGPDTQVWISGGSGSPPLVYRESATNQVDVWGGSGSDLTYNRGSNWPSPYMVVSVVANGSSSSIWENRADVVDGTIGGGGWSGLTVGCRQDGTLPAHIDVAEIVGYSGAMNDTDRLAVVNYLMSRYGL